MNETLGPQMQQIKLQGALQQPCPHPTQYVRMLSTRFNSILPDGFTDIILATNYEDCVSYLLPHINRDKFHVLLRGQTKEHIQLPEDLITILYELVLTKRSCGL